MRIYDFLFNTQAWKNHKKINVHGLLLGTEEYISNQAKINSAHYFLYNYT